MLANPPWRQLRERAEKIPGDKKHDFELGGFSHRVIALRSSIQHRKRPGSPALEAKEGVVDEAQKQSLSLGTPRATSTTPEKAAGSQIAPTPVAGELLRESRFYR
jgi:hypothetical protein